MSTKNRKKSRIDRSYQLKDIVPLTLGQEETFDAFKEGYHLFLYGAAGTGKTFLAIYLALQEILKGKYDKLVIFRSAVPSRDQGFLPGNLKEKAEIFEIPYKAICNDLFSNNSAYDTLKQNGTIEFVTTSYVRGITINDAVILIEECQNWNFGELDSVITRSGLNTRIILAGDLDQTDLTKSWDPSGLPQFVEIIKDMDCFDFVEFTVDDIVRGPLVKAYLTIKHQKGLARLI